MNYTLKQYTQLLRQSVLFWTIAMVLYSIFRYYGIESEEGLAVIKKYNGTLGVLYYFVKLINIGILIGVLYATVDFVFDVITKNRISLIYNIIIRTLLHFLVTFIVFTLITDVFTTLTYTHSNVHSVWCCFNKSFWAVILYIVFASFVFSFIKIANEKFGKGVFINILLGKYKNPQEEKRIFMFLDLKDSTTIAEKLGHFKYSQLIQDCFYDLNKVVPKHNAEIYQYVGDEVVLSWPYKKGLANNNCVNLFFAFQQRKQAKAAYYLKKYGVVPEFKAGLHGGKLMVTEVGIVKKEIAYHGDVINTSARIQGQCNTYKVPLLISDKLIQDLKISANLTCQFLGSVLLKGKQEEVNIHTIAKV
ncbi:adenylate/guanylate cyclase domain-containing protein [Aquimarina sp. BL5]|uniref:adenylate/guanylate cyclase domain-containing protein n=1 Tax=Aquimarina sp. BL5 TaxID=1714860 RepID=UPI000E52FC30|nr:adenylate/guanylate cyclase domain-containing protein [Aquimarina sp. BL5]AXT49500.1 adenylate/guanylate cyclase domain-containing protein [Aquimarina sp. BL5]RKN02510.1 adenylate/guanylate cyclase domain-containing protein [Aquimarina sp. BL5]